jgi:hypothetical protein
MQSGDGAAWRVPLADRDYRAKPIATLGAFGYDGLLIATALFPR